MPSNQPNPQSTSQSSPKRSTFLYFSLLILFANASWYVYHLQSETLPLPLSADRAGKRGFSEEAALKHVKYLADLGPHNVGSDNLDLAVKYVHEISETIKKSANWEVEVEIDLFTSKTNANRLFTGLFKGKTLLYSDLKHVVLKIVPKYSHEAGENVILVSSHIDTVFSTEGAGDCSSCIGVMLELARGISQWAHGFQSGVIFLFNTGEEEGLNGAHSFISQHPWSSSVKFAIDLEAMGIGGKSGIFQGGSAPWALETFASVAKHPTGQILAQDLFLSGAIKSATDFQIYQQLGKIPGFDFAYTDNTAVYHTKNDKMKLLKPGSLQHLGDNILAFLLHTCASSKLYEINQNNNDNEPIDQNQAVYFDILGMYMITYSQKLSKMLNNSIIFQSLLILITSISIGGKIGLTSFLISLTTITLTYIFSLLFSTLIAFILPFISYSPSPFISNPWLVIPLFGGPSLIGALTGQHLGFGLLERYLRKVGNGIPDLEAERWVFKSGFLQWLGILVLGNWFRIGSSYLAIVWIASPAFAYGLMEATLTPIRAPKRLKVITLIVSLALPILASSGIVFHLLNTLIGTIVRLDRNPGGVPIWMGNLIVAVYISIVICLMFVQILSYIHLSSAKRPLILSVIGILILSLGAVSTGFIPAFNDDISRTLNVVHVVESKGKNQEPNSYISLFSNTPGTLTKESETLKTEEFSCGTNTTIDFVTFKVKYGCLSYRNSKSGWSDSEIPILEVEKDSWINGRETLVSIDTKFSTRWVLAINKEQIDDFTLHVENEELVPVGDKTEQDGWHIIQFSGGKNSPTKFKMNLFWSENSAKIDNSSLNEKPILLKLRTDVDKITPKVESIFSKFPKWCSQFGKSTSPFNLAFFASIPVDF